MNDKLDDLLKQWANAGSAGAEHLHNLSRRISTEASHRRQPAVLVAQPAPGRLLYLGLGAAAALLIVFGSRLVSNRHATEVGNGGESLATISAGEMQGIRKLYGETERMFADQLRYISQSNGDIGMGVETIPGGAVEDARPVLARIVVVSRGPGESQWKRVWSSDVLLRGEELVEVEPNPGTDNRVALWVHTVSKGQVAVDTRLLLKIPVVVSSSASVIQSQGESESIAAFLRDGTEYRVYQAVRALDGNGGV